MRSYLLLAFAFFNFYTGSISVNAQKKNSGIIENNSFDTKNFSQYHWRNIGPYRAGRSLAVAGVQNDKNTYYFGAVGGGVWKTSDAGDNWICISDSTFHSSSVGAIAVAASDANIIYVGMGESEMRSNISFGDGMYKSMDAGKSWKKIGLENSYAIANIMVHPSNPDLLYASAQGNIWKPNQERGLYRSRDGGISWQQILFINDSTGCADIEMDPTNPRIMYASMWQAFRSPYSLTSGSNSCGLYKSTDGGDTWKIISKNLGMPKGMMGKICVSVSPANNQVVYALVENENGGLYKSEDEGKTWDRISTDKNLSQRPWYFSQLFACPKNEDELIVLNVQAWKSYDGGKTFKPIRNHHGDNHDCWINPNDPKNFIIGDDGGAEITFDDAKNFSDIDIPTSQFYHVNLDDDFPYNVYGAQQDNSSIKIKSFVTDSWSINDDNWKSVAGGEAGYIVPNPNNSHITYGGEYDGQLSKYNEDNGQYQFINVYPEAAIGSGAKDKKFRFNWTYPIVFSPHDKNKIYVTSQQVHMSSDGGQSWKEISPDLTRNDKSKQIASGGPITKDNTGAEMYNTIFAFAESYYQKDILWAGADDGMVNVSTDGGNNWIDVTPAACKEYALISIIEPSHFEAGTCYIAANKYKQGDSKPYLFKTTDFGKTWIQITKGINESAYCRVIREDPTNKNILYAGTEKGIYISINAGESWQAFQFNLPITPIHDIQIQNTFHDLVIATHGRSFWVLDDLTPLYQYVNNIKTNESILFQPRTTYRKEGGAYFYPNMQTGENAANGVYINYYLSKRPSEELKVIIYDSKGDSIISFSNLKDKYGDEKKTSTQFYEDTLKVRNGLLSTNIGYNRFVWDLRYPDATKVDGTNIMWAGGIQGPKAAPGLYTVKLYEGKKLIQSQSFTVLKDPRVEATDQDLLAQFDLMKKINQKVSYCHKAINEIRSIRKQLNDYTSSLSDTAQKKMMSDLAKPILDTIAAIESKLMQPKAQAPQDVLNYPIQLNDKIAGLGSVVGSADTRPTAQSYVVFEDLSIKIDAQLNKLNFCKENSLKEFNSKAEELKKPAIKID